jgi:hypothetical protein
MSEMTKILCWLGFHKFRRIYQYDLQNLTHHIMECGRCGQTYEVITVLNEEQEDE